jgi:hypothetical protein
LVELLSIPFNHGITVAVLILAYIRFTGFFDLLGAISPLFGR